ncbi:MAG: ATP-binding protein [Pirellulaceae bacterium]
MGYKTIKRAFGETNLERKCRFLFVVCLGLLIFGAFLWVDRVSEGLVKKTADQVGRDWVKVAVFHLHMTRWETDAEMREYIEAMAADLLEEDYQWSYLALGPDDVPWTALPDGALPESPKEEAVLRDLKARWTERLRAEEQVEPVDESTEVLADVAVIEDLEEEETEEEPIFATLTLLSEMKYCYYEPISWGRSCRTCHTAIEAFSVGDVSPAVPFRVVKVTTPYESTRVAIAKTRSILIAAAILTVFVAMVILYMIVRYVIVKPLQHLRDVSEEISRGNTELRADIHTNDEFEELADAFNRMLRHLIDAQGELRHANENLDGKVDELAQLNMRLYEMNRLKSDFLANMSHELRTPLNSIIGFSEVLQGIESLTDKQKRYACNIQKSGRVLLEMINDILDLAKIEAGKMEVRPTEFRIDTVITAQCDMVRSLTEEKNIDLEVHVSEDAPLLYQDQSKVQQILTNLLSNAIKFTPEGGRIDVTASQIHQDQFELTVADTGVGISEEDREIIFEKFRQSTAVLGDDGLTREYSGTGLGLSIVKELSKLLGGEITFESELGRGSTFKVVLPWILSQRPAFGAEVSRKLDELTRLKREDLPRE